MNYFYNVLLYSIASYFTLYILIVFGDSYIKSYLWVDENKRLWVNKCTDPSGTYPGTLDPLCEKANYHVEKGVILTTLRNMFPELLLIDLFRIACIVLAGFVIYNYMPKIKISTKAL